jgi:hypothetical protein
MVERLVFWGLAVMLIGAYVGIIVCDMIGGQ